MTLFDTYSTYDTDKPLLAELGLPPFTGKTWDEIYVGETRVEDAVVKLWVQGVPAQFWRFEVTFADGSTYRIETGSGSLTKYWTVVQQFASGCLVIEKI